MTDAAMKGILEVAAINLGFSPNEAFVYYPRWANKWPLEYRQQIAKRLEEMDESVRS